MGDPPLLILAAGVFGSAAMLLWAAAAAIPLLLHLWNRNRHVEVPWAAIEFLLAAVQQQTKRMRMEQLLLLLLRMAIPVVLAVALADPIWQWLPSLGASLTSRPPHHHLLIFDASYSMGYQVEARTRLAEAQQLAREIVNSSRQGDGFTLLVMADPPQAIVGSPAFASQDIMAEIAGLQLYDTSADLEQTLGLAQKTLENVRREHPRLEKHRVYFLSDMGANTWRPVSDPRLRELAGELESLAEIVTLDVGVEAAQNIGISEVTRRTSVTTLSSDVHWRVAVTNFASPPDAPVDIEMLVDGRLVDRQAVSFAGQQQVTALFRYQFDSSGQHRVEFRLTDDALPIDNHRYEVVTARPSINVLCVSGKPNAARNVALALAPSSDDTTIQTTLVSHHRLAELPLSDFDCVFLCNIARFTSDTVAQLRDYLRLGRGLVMFLGDRVQSENYNRMLAAGEDEPPILPARIGALAPPGSYLLDPQDYRHPIIQPFRGQQRTGLLTTPIWAYFRLTPPPDSRSRVALQFTNGDPAIIEHTVYQGRVALVATAASEQSVMRQAGQLRPWTAWSAWPSFPPIVQELLAITAEAEDERRNVFVGDVLGATLPSSVTTRLVTLSHEGAGSKDNRRLPVVEVAGRAAWSFPQTYRSGFYSAIFLDEDAPADSFAVNLAADQESSLQRLPLEKLPAPFQRRAASPDASGSDAASPSSSPLFRLLLCLLLVLLVAESSFAWYLGNGRA